MADGLNMGSLTLNDSQHAPAPGGPNPPGGGRAAYIPPHLRQRQVPANAATADAAPPPGPAGGSWGGPRYVCAIGLRHF